MLYNTLLVSYNVHPHSIYYSNEPVDVIYFKGSTIEFTCDVFCQHHDGCESRIFYNNSLILGQHNLYGDLLKYTWHKSEHSAKVVIKITDATGTGSYQCLTAVWRDRGRDAYIVSKEANFRMAGAQHVFIKLLCCLINHTVHKAVMKF